MVMREVRGMVEGPRSKVQGPAGLVVATASGHLGYIRIWCDQGLVVSSAAGHCKGSFLCRFELFEASLD